MKNSEIEKKIDNQEELNKQTDSNTLDSKQQKLESSTSKKELSKEKEKSSSSKSTSKEDNKSLSPKELEKEKTDKIVQQSKTKNRSKTLTTNKTKEEAIEETQQLLTKTEIREQIKKLSSKEKDKIIKSYDHNQPEITSKSSWDYKKLRSRTLKAMKKKEKLAIEEQSDPIAKELFQEIYDAKWKKYLQNNSKDNVIDVRNIRKYYINGTNVEYILKKISITIKHGEIYVILGASGSGKTTLLNIVSGLIDASSGDVLVQDKNLFIMNEKNKIKFRADNVSFVFQSYNLIPSLTVEENIKVGASLRSKNTEKVSVKEIMKLLKLYEQRGKYPFQLSGGQNQRVSIGRALSKNPKILFADEPTGALDEERGKEALQFLVDINEKYGTTIIMVTHNPNFKWVGDTTLKIHDGEIETLSHNKKRIKPKDIKWT